MDYQQAYKVAEEINIFFGLGFDGRKLAQLSQILINNAAQQSVYPTLLTPIEKIIKCPECHHLFTIHIAPPQSG